MLANVGTADRIVRIVVGLLLVVWFFFGHGGLWPWAGLVVGLILIATAAINFCPIWWSLGISTRAKKS